MSYPNGEDAGGIFDSQIKSYYHTVSPGIAGIRLSGQDQLESLSILRLPCTGRPPTVKVPLAGPARPCRTPW